MNSFSFFKIGGKSVNIFHSDILYIEANNKYIRIVTGNKIYLSSATMKCALEILPNELFCRVHKSYIVSLKHVSELGKNYLTIFNKKLPIGREYKKRIPIRVINRQTEMAETKFSNADVDRLIQQAPLKQFPSDIQM